MPTEQDLRNALTALADRAPSEVNVSDVISNHAPGRRSVARIALPLVAAIVVVAVAVTLSVLGARDKGASTEPMNSTPAPSIFALDRYYFSISPIPGYTVRDGGTEQTMQWMTVSGDAAGKPVDATVMLFPTGGFRPTRPARAQDVTVNGVPGFYGTFATQPNTQRIKVLYQGALAWEYAPNAWAVVFSPEANYIDPSSLPSGAHPYILGAASALSEPVARQIAEAVRPGQIHEVRVPVTFTTLPANATPVIQNMNYDTLGVGIFIGPATPGTYFSPKTLHVQVFAPSAKTGDEGNTGLGYRPVTFGAFHGAYYAVEDRIEVTNGTVSVNVGTGVPQGIFSLDDLEKTVEGMRFASSLSDESTWFPVSDVLPH